MIKQKYAREKSFIYIKHKYSSRYNVFLKTFVNSYYKKIITEI